MSPQNSINAFPGHLPPEQVRVVSLVNHMHLFTRYVQIFQNIPASILGDCDNGVGALEPTEPTLNMLDPGQELVLVVFQYHQVVHGHYQFCPLYRNYPVVSGVENVHWSSNLIRRWPGADLPGRPEQP